MDAIVINSILFLYPPENIPRVLDDPACCECVLDPAAESPKLEVLPPVETSVKI